MLEDRAYVAPSLQIWPFVTGNIHSFINAIYMQNLSDEIVPIILRSPLVETMELVLAFIGASGTLAFGARPSRGFLEDTWEQLERPCWFAMILTFPSGKNKDGDCR